MIKSLLSSTLISSFFSFYLFAADSFINFDFTDGIIDNGFENWSYYDLGENPCNVYNGDLQSKLCNEEGEKISAYYTSSNSYHKDWTRYGYIDASDSMSISGSALKVVMTGGAYPGVDGSVLYSGEPIKSKSQVPTSTESIVSEADSPPILPGALSIYFKTATSKTNFPKLQGKNRFSIWVMMPYRSVDMETYNKTINKRPDTMVSWYPFIGSSKGGHYYHHVSNIPMGGWTKIQFDAHPSHHNGRVDNEYHAFSEGGNDYPENGVSYFNNVAAFAIKPHFANDMPTQTEFYFDNFETDFVEFENEETINNLGIGYNPENHQFDISLEDKYRCTECSAEYDIRYSFNPINNENYDDTYTPAYITNFKRNQNNIEGKIYKSNNGYNQVWAAIDIQKEHISQLNSAKNIYFAVKDKSNRTNINQQSIDSELVDVPNLGMIKKVDLVKTINYQIIDVIHPLAFEPSEIADAISGEPYQHDFSVFGGSPPYQYSLVGKLPEGLNLNESGKIFGIPTMEVITEFIVKVTDKNNNLIENTHTLNVLSPESFNVEQCAVIVDFKDSEILSTIIDERFTSVFKDRYTGFTSLGATIMKGNNQNYNFQGIEGTGFSLFSGDKIRLAWKNIGAKTITFSPRVSFIQQGRYNNKNNEEWYTAASIQLESNHTKVSELTLNEYTSSQFINVNVNHPNNKTLILDKIEFVEKLRPQTDVCYKDN